MKRTLFLCVSIFAATLLGVATLSAQNTIAGNLTVQQTMRYTGIITPTTLSANVNNYAPTSFSNASILRLSANAARTVTGLAGGTDGRMLWLTNIGSYGITFSSQSILSSASNRFELGGTDFTLAPGSTMGLVYDNTSSLWRPSGSLGSGSGGSGSVTKVSVVTANGISGTVVNDSTEPAITLTLNDITPSSVAAVGAVTGSNLSGTNTGDQTTVSGNAGSATVLQTARTINGVSFNGSANVVNTTADIADSSNKRYVTDAQQTVIGNTSGTNTGDQTTVSGNAGSATVLQTARTINGVSFNGSADITITAAAAADGWVDAGETWTYASATTFTISGDLTTKYRKGDKVKWTQTTVKYAYVIGASYSSPNTTITIAAGSDYSVANATISANYYSKNVTPVGFPTFFNWSPTLVGWSSNPTGTVYRFCIEGTKCTATVRHTSSGTSNAAATTISLPVTAVTLSNAEWHGFASVVDNGTTTVGRLTSGSASTTMTVSPTAGGGNMTASGSKQVIAGSLVYEF